VCVWGDEHLTYEPWPRVSLWFILLLSFFFFFIKWTSKHKIKIRQRENHWLLLLYSRKRKEKVKVGKNLMGRWFSKTRVVSSKRCRASIGQRHYRDSPLLPVVMYGFSLRLYFLWWIFLFLVFSYAFVFYYSPSFLKSSNLRSFNFFNKFKMLQNFVIVRDWLRTIIRFKIMVVLVLKSMPTPTINIIKYYCINKSKYR